MTTQEFERVSEQIRELGAVSVLRLWIMGEPLLNKNIYEFIKLAKNTNSRVAERVEITTNGSMLNETNIEKLLDSKVDIVKISIYGIGNRHNEITGSKISSETIYENVSKFFNKRNELNSSTRILVKMVDPLDTKELEKFQFSYSPIADQVEVYSPHSWVEDHAIKKYESNFKEKSIIGVRQNLVAKKVCGFPFYTISIHANGDVSVCCVDWEKKTKIGNIHSESLVSIWNGSALREIQRRHLMGLRSTLPGCSTCDYFYDNCPEDLDDASSEILIRLPSDVVN